MYNGLRISFIIPAAGSGERLGLGHNKIFVTLSDRPVLLWSVATALSHPCVDEVLIVCREEELDDVRDMAGSMIAAEERNIPVRFVRGGARRADSVYAALKEACGDIVLIHDAARPFLKTAYVDSCLKALEGAEGAAVGVPVTDTVKLARSDSPDPLVLETVPRARAWMIQTPQCFYKDILLGAHELYGSDPDITDDCMLLERAGRPVRILRGDYTNMKITTPNDLLIAAEIARTFSADR